MSEANGVNHMASANNFLSAQRPVNQPQISSVQIAGHRVKTFSQPIGMHRIKTPSEPIRTSTTIAKKTLPITAQFFSPKPTPLVAVTKTKSSAPTHQVTRRVDSPKTSSLSQKVKRFFSGFKGRSPSSASKAAGAIPAAPKFSPERSLKAFDACVDKIKGQVQTEGLLRLEGAFSTSNAIKARIDSPDSHDIDEVTEEIGKLDDVHATGRLLKLVVEDMQTAAVKQGNCPPLVDWLAVRSSSEGLRDLVAKLPPENREMLGKLITLSHDIVAHSDQNKMGWSNIAITLTPHLFMGNDDLFVGMSRGKEVADMLQFMAENHATIFPGHS